jgi:hypothetical protein
MESPDAARYRSLERLCRTQAAIATDEVTKHELTEMAEEYRLKAEKAGSQTRKNKSLGTISIVEGYPLSPAKARP